MKEPDQVADETACSCRLSTGRPLPPLEARDSDGAVRRATTGGGGAASRIFQVGRQLGRRCGACAVAPAQPGGVQPGRVRLAVLMRNYLPVRKVDSRIPRSSSQGGV